jgi:long-subunit acyl-CoA synthetase (AMP-forming)
LSTLLENIAGLYAPLRAGALAQVPDLALCGMAGSSALQAGKLFAALSGFAPTTLVLVPQLLKALCECAAAGMPPPSSLRFVAVGGAPVPASLLERARSLGLPVYQGYGLSEAGSVVSLNLPGAERTGSVGKILPQHRISIAYDGEIVVGGNLFSGYLGSDPGAGDAYRTGDLGWLDAHGYLYLRGRKKTAYATAYGRKVAPEWVEGELASDPRIVQAAVFGDGRPYNVAVLVPRSPAANPPADLETELKRALESVNARLPDYARIRHWIVAEAPFTPGNGLANGAGCIRREAIQRHYQHPLEVLFAKEEMHVVL